MAAGLTVIHTLKLSHYTNRRSSKGGQEFEDYYVSMDIGELRRLKSVIDRAIGKHESLKGVVGSTKILLMGDEDK